MRNLLFLLLPAALFGMGCQPTIKEGNVKVTATADLGRVAMPPKPAGSR